MPPAGTVDVTVSGWVLVSLLTLLTILSLCRFFRR